MRSKIVIVTWRDSRLYRQQMDADGLHDTPTRIVSVGHLVRRNKDHLVLAMDRIEGEWRSVLMIPVENIVKVKKQ